MSYSFKFPIVKYYLKQSTFVLPLQFTYLSYSLVFYIKVKDSYLLMHLYAYSNLMNNVTKPYTCMSYKNSLLFIYLENTNKQKLDL